MKICRNCLYASFDEDKQPCRSCTEFCNFVDARVTAPAAEQVKPSNAGQRIYTTGSVSGIAAQTQTAGVKFDSGKPQWSLMQWKALTEVVKVLTYGASKYAPDNWKKVPNAKTRYIDAAGRHFASYCAGEKNDSETGISHLAHAMCCLLFLLAFELGEDKDDGIN